MGKWRQGDFVLGEMAFLWAADPSEAPVEHMSDAEYGEQISIETIERGMVVLTQTCDIVRSSAQRPFLEIAPLVPVDEQHLQGIRMGARPQYAYLPEAAAHHLVADLDRVMTVSKRLFSRYEPVAGCTTDAQRLEFSQALARKRVRFAFPDDFDTGLKPLRSRIHDKHDKKSPEGEALAYIKQIRVLAEPNWDAERVNVTFYFVVPGNFAETDRAKLQTMAQQWMDRLNLPARFAKPDSVVVRLEDITGWDYALSALLDLDHLSISGEDE